MKLKVKDQEIRLIKHLEEDYICITDIAKWKNPDANAVIANWIRNRNVLEYLGLWEKLYNPNFKPLEFEGFRKEAGLHAFTLSPQKWISATNAIGIICKSGRYGGTYANKDIAFHFANWISVEFSLNQGRLTATGTVDKTEPNCDKPNDSIGIYWREQTAEIKQEN